MIRRRRYVLLFVALALPAIVTSLACGADDAPHQWLRGTGDDLEIRLHGEVFEADGSPATAFEVSGEVNTPGNRKRPLSTTVDGNRFEAWILVNRVQPYSMGLKAITSDGSRLAVHKLSAFELRQAAIDGIRLTLATPTRHVEVKVLDNGKPAAGATVKAEMQFGAPLRATTDDNGIARFGLLPEQTLGGLMAWSPDRVGGFNFYRKPTRDPAANEFVIELSKCRDQTVRFIDEVGAPIEGVTFTMQIATPDPDYNFIGQNENSRLTTNAAGEAVNHWFPDWEKHHFYVDVESDDWIGDDEPETMDGVVVYQLKRAKQRTPVQVTLKGPAVAGLWVSVGTFQAERENHSESRWGWTDLEGHCSLNVLPDATYCAYMLDTKWVSPMVDAVLYDSALGQAAPTELAVSEGQEVEVFVTTGAEKKPYPHLSVAFFREHEYTWREDGETRQGADSAQWWATTDASGRAVTCTPPGPLKVKVYTPLWRTEEKIDVVAGQPAKVRLHCSVEEKRRLSGQLVVAGGDAADLAEAKITWGAVDGKFDEEGSLAADAKAAFTLEAAASQVGVFATTRSGRWAGSAVAKDLTKPLEVRLLPTGAYEGQLLGEGDVPLAGRSIRASIRVEGDEDYDGMFIKGFVAARMETTTDAQGKFGLTNVPSGMKVSLQADENDDPDSTHYLDDFLLEPGESRSLTVHRMAPKPDAAPAPLAERFKKARRDCQLLGYHLMVICSTGSALVSDFAVRRFVDNDENGDVGAYMQVVITGDQGKLSEEATNFLNEHGWQPPAGNAVAAWALDGTGRELAHVVLTVDDPEAPQAAADFLHHHMPPQVDATKKWDEAFAEAKRTGRRVWARIGGRYCGPCFRMARWLDDQRELVSKDYVLLKLDSSQDLHGPEVAERLTRGGHHGIPFHAIFDSGGQMLIDSAGPLGNVGHPTGFEGNKHLRKMLLETRQNLTDAEVDRLVQSVGE